VNHNRNQQHQKPGSTNQFPIHRYAHELPRMSDDEFDALKASITRHKGLTHPITVYDGHILDGRHRYEACLELGIEPEISHWQGDDDQALAFVMAANCNRRSLSVSQSAILAARAACLSQGQNKAPAEKAQSRQILTQEDTESN
jgi:ParB-like chromosome segregation protein Spo0J